MKVRVTLTVEVDPEVWNLEYGTGTASQAIREDVKAWVANLVDQSSDNLRLAG